jgi:hypothetical protein
MDFSCIADATPGLADVLENNSRPTNAVVSVSRLSCINFGSTGIITK